MIYDKLVDGAGNKGGAGSKYDADSKGDAGTLAGRRLLVVVAGVAIPLVLLVSLATP